MNSEQTASPASSAKKSRLRWAGGAALVLMLLVVAGVVWRLRGNPAKEAPQLQGENVDPRLAYTGPYENVHPDVRYVGDAACADCHPQHVENYRKHPMGRSMTLMNSLAPRQRYDIASHNPFDALGFQFRVTREGDHVWHAHAVVVENKPLLSSRQQAHYAIGSGTRGYSYLSVDDGFVLQTPISWFSQQQRWDLSPGFGPAVLSGRTVNAPCLQCHVNQARTIPGEPSRFQGEVFVGHAIGCERCHGPGEKHLSSHEKGSGGAREGFDPTIVNPAKLSWQRRDSVCEQCHLSGIARILPRGRDWFDFRPGLPLEPFLAIFVKDRDGSGEAEPANHFEQMVTSTCFQKSAESNKLGCLSCHDPHRKPTASERVGFFRDRCQKCHEKRPCTVPAPQRRATAPGDSCIDCHMPREKAANIAHTALTRHGIPRHPSQASRFVPASTRWTSAPVVHFHPDRFRSSDPESQRDLALALVQLRLADQSRLAIDGVTTRKAIRMLGQAVQRHPDDAEAWLGRGEMLIKENRLEEASASLDRALELRPDNLRILQRMATLAPLRKQIPQAIRLWHRLVELAPKKVEFRHPLANLCIQTGDWKEARRQTADLLKLDPSHAEGQFLWLRCLVHEGEKEAASKQIDLLRKLRLDNLAEIERWYALQVRP